MKKSHLILLAVTVATALFSAYSLAAVNYVYKLDYQWYSQFMKSYSSEPRNTDIYEWYSPELPHGSSFKVFSAKTVDRAAPVLANAYTLAQNDRGKYFLIYASLGKVNSLEYSIKIAGLAQRGNVIEVRVSMNSPLKKDSIHGSRAYEPCDIIRVEKSELSVTGQLHFIFKNQYGSKLYETQFILK